MPTLAELYLEECDGDVHVFRIAAMDRRIRLGQAFFNALGDKDQAHIRGTLYDPFHKDTWEDVLIALEFLMA